MGDLIEPAARQNDYVARRSVDENASGEITSRMIDNLMRAPLVICDLTGLNANVFYEMALRHAANKPFIHIASEDTELPFNVQSIDTIRFPNNEPAKAKRELTAKMGATRKRGFDPRSPVTQSTALGQIQGVANSHPMVRALRNAVQASGAQIYGIRRAFPSEKHPSPDSMAVQAWVDWHNGYGEFVGSKEFGNPVDITLDSGGRGRHILGGFKVGVDFDSVGEVVKNIHEMLHREQA